MSALHRSLVLSAVLAAGCNGGGGEYAPTELDDLPGGPVTITLAAPMASSELEPLRRRLDLFERTNPDVAVRLVADRDAGSLAAAAIAARPPDLAWLKGDGLGGLCASGALEDLEPRIQSDGFDMTVMPEGLRELGVGEGRRCGLPVMADAAALYVNLDLARRAGHPDAPAEMSELAELAVALTRERRSGELRVIGFPPADGGVPLVTAAFAHAFDAPIVDENGLPSLSGSAAWERLLRWQRGLSEAVGAVAIRRFLAVNGSAEEAFAAGSVAMVISDQRLADRLASLASAPEHQVVPVPVGTGGQDRAGSGPLRADLLAIPAGAEHADQAWAVARFLVTDTDTQVELANALWRLPISSAAIEAPALRRSAQLDALLAVLVDPDSTPLPFSPAGAALLRPVDELMRAWASGRILSTDLADELRIADEQMTALLAATDPG